MIRNVKHPVKSKDRKWISQTILTLKHKFKSYIAAVKRDKILKSSYYLENSVKFATSANFPGIFPVSLHIQEGY